MTIRAHRPTSPGVKYRCARCHTEFSSDEDTPRCPTCHAESGIEPVHRAGLPMRLFGTVLAAAACTALVGGIVARLNG
ncbi:MAG: zinc ribbon domain-containing protein [Deltaproteobacteria bacterium]|nr:MAG: zinc ribbon domain-containing protein [Deltaproteobacteria bacterium]